MKNKIVELLIESGYLTQEQGEYIINLTAKDPVKGHMYTYTDAQLAIVLAQVMLEKAGADTMLTNAGLNLQNALDGLSEYLVKQQDLALI